MRRAGVFDRRARLGRRDRAGVADVRRGTEKCRDTRRPAIRSACSRRERTRNPRPSLAHLPLTTTCRQGPPRSPRSAGHSKLDSRPELTPAGLKMLFAMPSLDRTDGCLMDRLDVCQAYPSKGRGRFAARGRFLQQLRTSVAMKSFLAIAALFGTPQRRCAIHVRRVWIGQDSSDIQTLLVGKYACVTGQWNELHTGGAIERSPILQERSDRSCRPVRSRGQLHDHLPDHRSELRPITYNYGTGGSYTYAITPKAGMGRARTTSAMWRRACTSR